MQTVLVVLRSFGLLLLQPDDLTLLQRVATIALVVFGYLAVGDAYLLTYRLESVATTGIEIVVLIVYLDGVQLLTGNGRTVLGMLGHEAVVSGGSVVLIEPIELYEFYETVGILRVGGIARRLEAACPTFIVGGLQRKKRTVTLAISQETRMVLVGVEGRRIGTEAFVALVVVAIDGATCPAMTLDAKVVVALHGQLALSRSTLEDALCQGDAGRYLPSLHLFDGDVLVLVNVLLIALVPAHLRPNGEGNQENTGQQKANSLHNYEL